MIPCLILARETSWSRMGLPRDGATALPLPLPDEDFWQPKHECQTLVVEAAYFGNYGPKVMIEYVKDWWKPPQRPDLVVLFENTHSEKLVAQLAAQWGGPVRVLHDPQAWTAYLPSEISSVAPAAPQPPRPPTADGDTSSSTPGVSALFRSLIQNPVTAPAGMPGTPSQGVVLCWSEQGGLGLSTLVRTLGHQLAHRLPSSQGDTPFAALLVSLHTVDPIPLRAGHQPAPNIGQWLADPQPEKLPTYIWGDLGGTVGVLPGFQSPPVPRRLVKSDRQLQDLIPVLHTAAPWLIFDVPAAQVPVLLPVATHMLFLCDATHHGQMAVVLTNDWLVASKRQQIHCIWVVRQHADNHPQLAVDVFTNNLRQLWQQAQTPVHVAFNHAPLAFVHDPHIPSSQTRNELPLVDAGNLAQITSQAADRVLAPVVSRTSVPEPVPAPI